MAIQAVGGENGVHGRILGGGFFRGATGGKLDEQGKKNHKRDELTTSEQKVVARSFFQSKAAEDSRTPRPCGVATRGASRGSVLECPSSVAAVRQHIPLES